MAVSSLLHLSSVHTAQALPGTLLFEARTFLPVPNEPATSGGKLEQGSRTARFKELVNVPVHVPLSGRTIAFNEDGGCTAGCD